MTINSAGAHGAHTFLLAACALVACARGPASPARPGDAAEDAGTTTLVTAAPEPSGTRCSRGGVKVGLGPDTDGNGVLEKPEVTTISYVCNAGGRAGVTIVTSASEPPGAHCSTGGLKLEMGPDTDGDGSVGPGELTHTSYVCNGEPRRRPSS